MDELYKIRPVEMRDIKDIWKIKNHPEIRKVSGSDEIIPFDKHCEWFKKKYFSGESNICYVLDDIKSGVIGYCRLDYTQEKDSYVVSIAIIPGQHGRGLGGKLINNTLAVLKNGTKIFASVKKDNQQSYAFFKKNNFTLQNEDDIFIHFCLIK